METRPKLVVHEGLTQLQEMRLEMLRTVLWRILVLPIAVICALVLLSVITGWIVIAFVSPLVRLIHGS
jgi:hypothetical protein